MASSSDVQQVRDGDRSQALLLKVGQDSRDGGQGALMPQMQAHDGSRSDLGGEIVDDVRRSGVGVVEWVDVEAEAGAVSGGDGGRADRRGAARGPTGAKPSASSSGQFP